jgi:DNA-binding transcriptional ArsR family regulator
MSSAEKQAGLRQAARLFGVLAEPARLRILQLLRDGSMCGRELARDLNLTPATTCHHLEKLKLANLLSERRSGRHIYYSLSDAELAKVLRQSLATLEDSPPGERQTGKREGKKNSKRNNKTKCRT